MDTTTSIVYYQVVVNTPPYYPVYKFPSFELATIVFDVLVEYMRYVHIKDARLAIIDSNHVMYREVGI